MARKGAQVIMACRNLDKAEIALKKMCNEFSEDKLETMHLDLSDLSSVKNFAAEIPEKI